MDLFWGKVAWIVTMLLAFAAIWYFKVFENDGEPMFDRFLMIHRHPTTQLPQPAPSEPLSASPSLS
jgi:hypothetical protein